MFWSKALLFLLFGLLALVESAFVYAGIQRFSETWFLFFLAGLGMLSLVIGRRNPVTPIFGLLLASLAVLVSFVSADELHVFGSVWGSVLGLLWNGLLFLFPFVFVHFALTFPVPAQALERKAWIAYIIYCPWVILLVLYHVERYRDVADFLALVCILGGMFAGLVIFYRQYHFRLTPAEKNRLRVVLIGCLAGAVPRTLALMGDVIVVERISYFLLPLFPICLAYAVLKENFAETGRTFHVFLAVSLLSAGLVTVFFLAFLGVSILSRGGEVVATTLLISGVFSVVFSYPLWRFARSYVFGHFPRGRPDRLDEKEPEFRPVHPNPYIVGNPVRSPEMFFGRDEDFRFIRSRLTAQRSGSVIVLQGERRAGKTSVLYQIVNGRLGPSFHPVFVDMQGVIVQDDSQLAEMLGMLLRKACPDYLPARAGDPVRSYPMLTDLVEEVIRRLGDRHLLILVDEYELIQEKVDESKVSGQIYRYLNSLLERFPGLSFIFTGSRKLEENTGWSILLGKAAHRNITFLDWKDAEQLIRVPLAGRVKFAGRAVFDLIRLTHGHPFYTQAVCQAMVEVINERENSLVDRKIVEETVEKFLAHPPSQLLYDWESYDYLQKLALSALATLAKTPEAYVSVEKVDRLVDSLPQRFRGDISPGHLRIALEQLRRRTVLDRDQTRYRFTMDVVRLRIQREHSLWDVMSGQEARAAH